jgi:L-alanine-DL-glutamate epimerase-like enolase superfamily enzyme
VREIELAMLEQPLPPSSAAFMTRLVEELRVDVAADEAVRAVADASTVARERSATVVNVGHSKLGGPTAALHAAQVARAAGVDVMVGSVIEMDIATAMGLHLAAVVPRLAYPSYLMGPLKNRQQITDEQVEVVGGHIAVPQGAGLGISVNEKVLRELDLRRC